MRIKKDPATKNEYIAADGVWVRNFAKDCVSPVNLSPLVGRDEYVNLVDNEEANHTRQITNISDEDIGFRRAVIVSDGYDFDRRHRIISEFPSDVAVIAVNRALVKWTLLDKKRPINLYVVNNPYVECMGYLPKNKYFPSCVASSRTHPEFIKKYAGRIYLYEPTPARSFGLENNPVYFIDDYRNPICAAIGLAYRFGVEKLMLMCCDDSFVEERDASVPLPNGLFTYPQHVRTQHIVDANLYWYKAQGGDSSSIADFSSGLESQNAAYITNEEEAVSFFTTEE
jgi:hypothetical protein